ncbi:MAG: phosphatidylserine/phosphatidylglycerophosphate/cardiolipin synthase family protein [Enhydrobacter sp.]|nr:MAG: phosphatidylserine/phosphatidylglycerophosphate/cardiolipin synthase family protein [Enhydrobacter sp.]
MHAADPYYIPFARGSYPVRPGNRLHLLLDGAPIFRRIGEAVERARHSVWMTVAFYTHAFQFPGGRGGLFDVLDRAVDRGLDVRLLLWRPNPESYGYDRTFRGSADDFEFLRRRGSRCRIRWDRVPAAFCQHQKNWLIDVGQPSETVFVGGANLSAETLWRHDAYLEIAGPAATDVRHNFVQRWNEASERAEPDGSWACDPSDSLPFPTALSQSTGTSTIQIQRMLHPRRYTNGQASPGAPPFDVGGGERSILDQYLEAIDAARRTIYLEHQAIPIPEVAARLGKALERGVAIVLLVPAEAEAHVLAARRDPAQRAPFDSLARLGQHPNFLLAGLAERGEWGPRPKYVHAKLMTVDDCWATVGSCNLHWFSLSGHSELNASIWDAAVAREIRCRLFDAHLGVATAALDDVTALRLYRTVALANRRRMLVGSGDWEGATYALDTANYAVT